MAATRVVFAILVLSLFFFLSSSTKTKKKPCKEMEFYFHDILYNGENADNATSAIVAAPSWSNKSVLAEQNHFGNIVIFDDPITKDNNLYSTHIARAQGFYLYDRKDYFTAWLAFTITFNSTEYQGTITFAGADPMAKHRDISVSGGTGDFLMARGIATITSDAVEGSVYFRLRFNVKFYECWW